MSDQAQLVIVDYLSNGVAQLTLNNPPLNLVTLELTRQLEAALNELESDDRVRCIVLTGGDKAFCAGSDIKEFPGLKNDVVERKLTKENAVYSMVEFLSKPVIAAMEGFALGGGCELSLCCDIRIMAESSKIGLPEIKLGVFPGSGGIFRLPKLIGHARAAELMYRGNFITAQEAERIGLVNRVVPDGEAIHEAVVLAEEIAAQAHEAVKYIKRGIRESLLLPYDEALQLTLDLSREVFKTDDCAEGVRAFFEKRKPQFNGTATNA